MRPRSKLRWSVLALGFVGVAFPTGASAEDWLTFAKTPQRDGYNSNESFLSTQTVPGLHLLWQFPMNGSILTQPLLASGIPVDDGTGTGTTMPFDLVYVADATGLVAAFDAGGSGMIWGTQLPILPTDCDGNPTATGGYIGTPTIDKPLNRMWVVAADGTLWALALDTGSVLPGYPVQVVGDQGLTVNYGGLTYQDGTLYVTTAAECEVPPYHGQAIKVTVGTTSTATPQVAARWYPTGATGPDGGGIWGFGGLSLETDGAYAYAATGNALAQPENTGFADQVVKLDASLQPVAADAPALSGRDEDFGGTPMLYQPPNCPPQMAVTNKAGLLFIYDRSTPGIQSGSTQRIQVTETVDNFIGQPAYDPTSNQLYLANPGDDTAGIYQHGLLAFAIQADCTLALQWQQPVGFNSDQPYNPMIPPIVANNVVYYSTGAASSVFAFDSAGNYLWDSGQQITGGIFNSPAVVNGLLLVADYSGNLTAFGP